MIGLGFSLGSGLPRRLGELSEDPVRRLLDARLVRVSVRLRLRLRVGVGIGVTVRVRVRVRLRVRVTEG